MTADYSEDELARVILELLRENEGERLRGLLTSLKTRLASPEASHLYDTLITHPDLRDLVPH